VNGHTIPDLIETLGRARATLHRPAVIIASTVKGSGVPFIENNLNYHTAPLTDDELKRALGYFG
jgi:transketolase